MSRKSCAMGAWSMVVVLSLLSGCAIHGERSNDGVLAKPQWKIGIQTASFKPVTYTEAIDRVHALSVKYVALHDYYGLSPDRPNVPFNCMAPPEIRDVVKQELACSGGIKLVNYFFQFRGGEAELRKQFAFAKDMGVETMEGEPPADDIALMDRLANEYEINVAVHNHPRAPNSPGYVHWNPDTVLQMIKGCSKRIGVCPDVGHWARSGVNPVEALKKCAGRIITVHIKDVEKCEHDARGVPLGKGVANIKGVLDELQRQQFSGTIMIEHEQNRPNNQSEVAECVIYLRRALQERSR